MPLDPVQLKEQIEYICSEKGLEPSEVIKAIENSIASAYRKQFGDPTKNYEARFDLNSNLYDVYETYQIVDEVLYPEYQLSLIDARLSNPQIKMGDVLKNQVDTAKDVDFGRIASQVAKQVLSSSLNNARHTKLLSQFKDKIGDVVNVEIDYYQKGGYQVKLGQTFGYLSRENLMPIDKFKSGTMVKALILDLIEDARGNSRIILSRSHPDFIKALIRQEIPEVENGLVTIDKIVREPGFRSKILVSTTEGENIDPIGTILGRRNMRIINILRQISITMQEKIDIIENQPENLDLMVMDALEPAEIDKVELDLKSRSAIVRCYKDEAALAVGRRGVNIKLAQELLDLDITIAVYEEEGRSEHSAALGDAKLPEIVLE